MIASLVPPVAGCVSQDPRSGGAKRKAKNALPRVCLVLCKATSCIVGAMLMTRCVTVAAPPQGMVRWVIARFVALVLPVLIHAGDFTFRSAVSKLVPKCEYDVRILPTLAGGNLNKHFSEYTSLQWSCFPCSPEMLAALDAFNLEVRFDTKVAVAACLGVSHGNGVLDAEPSVILEEAAVAIDPCAHGEPAQSTTAAVPSVSELARLSLRGLYVPTESGAVTHRFTVQGLLDCLDLAASLKPNKSLGDVLGSAARIFFGVDGALLAGQLQSNEMPLPQQDVLRTARVRLDQCNLLFQRGINKTYNCLRYLMIDSSPQLGWNFLMVLEDRIMFRRSEDTGYSFRAAVDINMYYERRTMLVSTLGHGHSVLVKKSINCANIYLMETDDAPEFHVVRDEVININSDQGTEAEVCDDTVGVVKEFEDAYEPMDNRSFLWPRALWTPGHLHILWNALAMAFKELDIADEFMAVIEAAVAFLNDKQLRRKFQATCVFNLPCQNLFTSFKKVHCDWRWEFFTDVLAALVPLFCYLRTFFNVDKILASDSGQKLNSKVVKELGKQLASRLAPLFEVLAEMFQVVGGVIARNAGELELCCCHMHIWKNGKSFKRRAAELLRVTGRERCVWKGRRAAWWVAVGLSALYYDILNATSALLDNLLEGMVQARALVTSVSQQLRGKLHELLYDKLSFWTHVPYKLLGVFYCTVDESWTEKAKQLLRECIDEFEKADPLKLHRVAVRLLDPLRAAGRAFRNWLQASSPLREFPAAFWTLLEYCLCSLAERAVERLHAIVARLGRGVTNIHPPYLCAKVREHVNLELLKASADFHELVIRQWHSKTFLDTILQQRYDADTLRTMSRLEKSKATYQCSLGCEYASTADAKAARKRWLTGTGLTRAAPVEIEKSLNPCVKYMKEAFQSHAYYSLPNALFTAMCGDERLVGEAGNDGPSSDALAAFSSPSEALPYDVEGHTTLVVLNPKPEASKRVPVNHISKLRSCVNVARCVPLAKHHRHQALVVQHANDVTSLDLTKLGGDIGKSLASVFRWRCIKHVPCVVPNPSAISFHSSDTYALPAVAGTERQSNAPSGSSNALALAASVGELSSKAHCLLQVLKKRQSETSADVALLDLPAWEECEFQELVRVGAVTLRNDDFGSTTIALNRIALTWWCCNLIGEPQQLFRARLDGKLQKLPKLELVFRLQELKWVAVDDPLPLVPRGQLSYRFSMSAPASYFVALLEQQSIFEKGVTQIVHNQTDNFYKCLVLLDGSKLLELVASMEGKNDVWFQKQLKDGRDDDEESVDVEEGPLAIADAPLAIEDGLPCILPPVAESHLWTRCIVTDSRGGEPLKIFFDNESHQSGRQRGWCNNTSHSCIKYFFCAGSKELFCTRMYVWNSHALENPHQLRKDVLKWEPDETAVGLALPCMTLSSF